MTITFSAGAPSYQIVRGSRDQQMAGPAHRQHPWSWAPSTLGERQVGKSRNGAVVNFCLDPNVGKKLRWPFWRFVRKCKIALSGVPAVENI